MSTDMAPVGSLTPTALMTDAGHSRESENDGQHVEGHHSPIGEAIDAAAKDEQGPAPIHAAFHAPRLSLGELIQRKCREVEAC